MRAHSTGQNGALVRLQTSTPGVLQVGHLNVSGTVSAGEHVGGGVGLLGVNADLLDGLNSSAFLQAIPNPLSLTGTAAGTAIIKGVNLSPNQGYGVIGEVNATSGTNYGVRGSIQSTSGSGVHGRADALAGTTIGTSGASASSSGKGIYGYASSTTGTNYGGFFESNSSSGRGIYANATRLSGQTYGAQILAQSSNAIAISGDATAASGATFGGYFVSRSTGGQAVHGVATAASGITYGVVGEVGSAAGYGLYFLGRLAGSGTKSFRIDHPHDPLNKYLLHYCAEGPEPRNVYQGTVTTDGKGVAWVELPSYYQEINRDPQYQLTVVEDKASTSFVQVKVARKIKGNQFMIMSSAPNVEVSWRIDAIRNDRFVQKHGAPVEEAKEGVEKGKYQDSSLYGAPPEMGMRYRPDLWTGRTK